MKCETITVRYHDPSNKAKDLTRTVRVWDADLFIRSEQDAMARLDKPEDFRVVTRVTTRR